MPEQIRPDLALLEVAQKDTVHTPRQPRTLPARTRSRAMRTTTAFFAGAGTIAVALAAGLGGGLLISNIVSPHAPKQGAELSKVERRTTIPFRQQTPHSNLRLISRRHRRRQPNPSPSALRHKPSHKKPGNNRLSRKRNKPTLRRFPTRSLPRPRRKPLPVSHPQPLTMRSPGRAILTSNASCAVPRNSARPNAASNGWRSAATAVAGMTSFAMSN